MDSNLKLKWINALESGKYEQGIGTLFHHTSGKYCCLGVLASCMGYEKEEIHSGSINNFLVGKNTPSPLAIDMESKLIVLNDSDKLNFKEIAQYIKEFVPVEESECQNNLQ